MSAPRRWRGLGRLWPGAVAARSESTALDYLPDADEIERSPAPRFAQFTLHLMLLAFVAAAVWASVSKVDLVVSAQGRLVNPLPNVVVQPLETSIVKSIDVRVGQWVKKGQALATLDATFAEADGSQLQLRLASLETQWAGLAQELSGAAASPVRAASGVNSAKSLSSADGPLQATLAAERQAHYRAQKTRMAQTLARLHAALDTNVRDQQLIEVRLKSLHEIEDMQERMVAQKYSAPLQLLEAQQRTQEVQRERTLAANKEQELRRDIEAFEAESLAFEKNWRQKAMEEMLTISREREALTEQIRKSDRRQKMITLTAPMDAVVLEIAKLSPGSIAREAETFFSLVPAHGVLEAEVQIDSADVGYIEVGNLVHLKLDAFPFQRHGTLAARVSGLSQDAFKREVATKSAVTDAYFSAHLRLDEPPLKNMKPGAVLLPGMTLTAEIVVGQRSVLSYLAWPLTKGLNEAIREP